MSERNDHEKESFREKILSDLEKQRLQQYINEQDSDQPLENADQEHLVPEFEAFKNSENVSAGHLDVPETDLSAEQVLDHLDHLFDPSLDLTPTDPLNPDYSENKEEKTSAQASTSSELSQKVASESVAQSEATVVEVIEQYSASAVQSETASSEEAVAYERYYDPERGKFVRRRLSASQSEEASESLAQSDSVPYEEVAITYSAAGTTVPVTYHTSQAEEEAEALAQSEEQEAHAMGSEALETTAPIDKLKKSLADSVKDQPSPQATKQADSELPQAPSPEAETDKTPSRSQSKKVKKQANLAGRIAKRIILFFVFLLIVGGLGVSYYVYDSLQPVDKTSSQYVQVEIPEGAGTKLIGQTLQKAGVIKSAMVFNYYTKFRNYSSFAAGYYNIQKSMSMDKIIKTLQAGGTSEPTAPVAGKVTIPEGYTITQIAQAITDNVNTKKKNDKTPFKADDFLKLVQDDSFIAKMKEKYPTLLANLPDKSSVTYVLEGYLFPATYNYYDNTSLEDLVDQMLQAMNSNLSPYYDTIAASGKTVHEVLTLASIVEKEGNTDDDRRKIASVFYNRLNAGMALQSNVPLLYASGKLGTTTTLAEDAAVDTSMDSPYNDYTNTGYPPGPVDSPGLSSLKAVIEPDSTEYLYFVADVDTGTVYYSKTYEEHQANVDTYVNSKLSSSSSSSE
ncbi:endolytic transglycosylase MltG [Streptococcus sp. DD12]|uniref:endolytic transglycosylase MltG n=1 Tax=Streptococcus sp. DD12 TaxID=1777880 RepID=UPI000798E69B|nr:endolytic transglycosylase MltG [Streptococcus sp. DD12]KXT75550.1 protein YceG like [Streptococcus sp. DD12]